MKFKEYLIIYIKINDGLEINDQTRFWAITCIFIGTGGKIQMDNGHYLTPKDCLMEINDLVGGYVFEGGWVRAWWEQFQYLRGLIDKPYWM